MADQSVCSYVGASAWQAAMAAWTTYGSGRSGLRRRASPTSSTPASAIAPASHSDAVLIGEQHRGAVGVDAGRAAGVLQQHQGQQPGRAGARPASGRAAAA